MRLTRDAQAVAEILEVRVVRHLFDARIEFPASTEHRLVLKVHVASRRSGSVVIGEKFKTELALTPWHQISEFAGELNASLAEIPRFEHEVVVLIQERSAR